MSTLIENQSREYAVLDPSLLGRPVHLLPQFAARLAEDLAAALQSPSWRRSWSPFRLETVEFGRAPDEASLRWLGVAGPRGMAAVAFERRLLLALLHGRYGRSAHALPAHDVSAEPVTATEERLAGGLTRQLSEVLLARVNAGLALAGVAPVKGEPAPAAPMGAPGKSSWAIRVLLTAMASGEQLHFWIAPDAELMGCILRGLLPEKGRARNARHASEPLAARLQVKLDGRLVSKEISLAALFELKVGDVIPVSVGRADVLLDEARLFTAVVAEHKGKLCLTSFEDAE
jgi:flagellar motor switch protein FliM